MFKLILIFEQNSIYPTKVFTWFLALIFFKLRHGPDFLEVFILLLPGVHVYDS